MTQLDTTPRQAALVTGGSSGIGLAVARALLDDGFAVTICGRDPDRLEQAAAALAGAGRLEAVVADVTASDDVAGLVEAHETAHGRLDVLVNSAGAVGLGGVTTASLDDLDAALKANVRSAWAVTAAASTLLQQAGQEHGRATVATIGSILGRHGSGAVAAYSTAKAALFGLMQAVNDELSVNGVRATTIAPAFVATPLTEPLAHLDRETMIRPDDVAETVRYLTRLSSSCAVPEVLLLRTVDRLLPL